LIIADMGKNPCKSVEQEENRKNAYAGHGLETIWEMSGETEKKKNE